MKIVEKYACEICGRVFSEAKAAERCEEEHNLPVDITKYDDWDDNKRYHNCPRIIWVRAGKYIAKYRFDEVVED